MNGAPPDKLVHHLDILLHVCHLHGLLRVEHGEGRERGTVLDILATGLEEATDEEKLEERVCILEVLESSTGLD